MRTLSRQISLRPHDLVVALKLALLRGASATFVSLGAELALAPSEVHASIGRALLARLVTQSESAGTTPIISAIREFVIHGVKYAFPPVSGPLASGIPTGYGAPVFRGRFQPSDAPVWPHPDGKVRGPTLYPLYPGLPIAAGRDARLYDLLAIVDAIRAGAAREREYAATLLAERLA